MAHEDTSRAQLAGKSVVVAGGGTAGHIEPALAVADSLKRRYGVTVTALGTTRGLERELVPARGVTLRMIDPVPVPRKINANLFKLPWRVLKAVRQAKAILDEVDADALIGFGGYVSAPAYLAAKQKGLLFYAHEANAKAGLANKLGVWLGGTGLTAVKDCGLEGDVVGIPIRKGIVAEDRELAAERARKQWGLDKRPTIFLTGGSQGAASLNKALHGAIDELIHAGYQVLHAYGKKNDVPEAKPGYVPVAFITDMAAAYAVADLIVCRSGAMTVAEVTAAGLPAIYVPLPHGNGEQGLNAKGVIEAGAARCVPDSELDSARLVKEINRILDDEQRYQAMQQAARQKASIDVADQIADRIAGALELAEDASK